MCQIIKYAGMAIFCRLIFVTSQVTGQLHDKYVGCFVDNKDDRKLEPVLINRDDLTIEICVQKCYDETDQTKSEMTFAAMTNGRLCICRNNHGHQLRHTKCNVKCSGVSGQNCGGNQTDAFYSLYTVCGIGYFGLKCDQPCHCKRHLPCDRKTGICLNGCDEKWTGTSCNTGKREQLYIGCYGDGNVGAKALDVANIDEKTGTNNRSTNSIEFCVEICSDNGYTYAGMQYGYDCHCGEKYSRYGNKTFEGQQVNCNYPCPRNRKQKCGGRYANSVYHVCPRGFYGRHCVNRCRCNGDHCRFNGTCLNSTLSSCKPGWTGSTCTTRDCSTNNGDCGPGEICEIVDLGFAQSSMCRCKDGYFRDNNTCRPTSHHYVGCYQGSTSKYVAVKLPTSDTLNIEFCLQECSQLNKMYSIIKGGDTCLCGGEYGQISRDVKCQVPCAGNELQFCGGKNTTNAAPTYVVYTAKSFLRQYIGCYKDDENRAMEKHFPWGTARNNTIESCIRHCGSNGYAYAGLQFGTECFCGDSYDKHGPLIESSCNMKCSGNRHQTCGGNWANSVYAVNDILWCSSERDCKQNEFCNIIDLHYANVSRCRCKKGFHRMSTWEQCRADVDECQSGASTCNKSTEYCLNSVGSYKCECKDGFAKISGYCEADVDECQSDASTCNPTTEYCVNSLGSYTCECKDGFAKISGYCEDIDECGRESLLCDTENEHCENTIGSYVCHRKSGYESTNIGNCTGAVDKCQFDGSSNSSSSQNETSERGITSIEFNSTTIVGIILGTLLAITLLTTGLIAVCRLHSTKSRKPESAEDMAPSDLERSSENVLNQHEAIYAEIQNPVGQNCVYEQITLERREMIINPKSVYEQLKLTDHVNAASNI